MHPNTLRRFLYSVHHLYFFCLDVLSRNEDQFQWFTVCQFLQQLVSATPRLLTLVGQRHSKKRNYIVLPEKQDDIIAFDGTKKARWL